MSTINKLCKYWGRRLDGVDSANNNVIRQNEGGGRAEAGAGEPKAEGRLLKAEGGDLKAEMLTANNAKSAEIGPGTRIGPQRTRRGRMIETKKSGSGVWPLSEFSGNAHYSLL